MGRSKPGQSICTPLQTIEPLLNIFKWNIAHYKCKFIIIINIIISSLSEEDLAHQIVIYGEIADEARSQGGQGKRYKDTL